MGTNRFSAMYRFSALFGGDGKKRYIGTPLYIRTKNTDGGMRCWILLALFSFILSLEALSLQEMFTFFAH